MNDRIKVTCETHNKPRPGRELFQYVVTLDGVEILRTNGASTPDHGEAQAFARGLARGLELAK